MKKFIVKRTYSVKDNKPYNQTLYISIPFNFTGMEGENSDIKKAYIFDSDNKRYLELYRNGNFETELNNLTYKFHQEQIEYVKPEVSKDDVLNAASDAAKKFLYYDRKNDENLFVGEIQSAVKRGIVTTKQIVQRFEEVLRKEWNNY